MGILLTKWVLEKIEVPATDSSVCCGRYLFVSLFRGKWWSGEEISFVLLGGGRSAGAEGCSWQSTERSMSPTLCLIRNYVVTYSSLSSHLMKMKDETER